MVLVGVDVVPNRGLFGGAGWSRAEVDHVLGNIVNTNPSSRLSLTFTRYLKFKRRTTPDLQRSYLHPYINSNL